MTMRDEGQGQGMSRDGGDGREAQEERDICIFIADPHGCTAGTDTTL